MMAGAEPTTAELWAGLLDWLSTFEHGDQAVNHINLVDNPGMSIRAVLTAGESVLLSSEELLAELCFVRLGACVSQPGAVSSQHKT